MANVILPVSQPSAPAQPSTEFYSTQDLALFKAFTRDSYRTAFGVEARAYDPARLLKSWFDSTVDVSDPGNVAVYRVVAQDQNGKGFLRQVVMPAQEAATVNLPGAIQYPPYVVAPTLATRGGSALNAVYLSLESDAQTLLSELGGTDLQQEDLQPFPASYPSDEPRRPWNFLVQGQRFNVGALLMTRNAGGVGSPGHWDVSSPQLLWVADVPGPNGLDDTRPVREMPVRSLLPNEMLYAGPLGLLGVVRTDLQKAADEQSGQFTPDDRAMLRAIYLASNKLAS